MASLYIIVDTTSTVWSEMEARLPIIRKNCVPGFNQRGNKALIQLKDSDRKGHKDWANTLIAAADGILWSGTIEELPKQRKVSLREWDDPTALLEPHEL